MKNDGVKRGYVIYDNGQLKTSGGIFDDVSKYCSNESPDFAEHEVNKNI
jgi:hypothetical protein